MSFPEEWGADGGDSAPTESKLVVMSATSNEALLVKTLLARSLNSARLVRVQRVQNKRLWRAYSNFRDQELVLTCGGDVNERLLFHGTGERSASMVLAHPHGIDPRFSNGGFYGHGIYLADDPSYPIGGRYAHRVAGSRGRLVELIVVRAALGRQQEMGQHISKETRAMRMPGVRRVEGNANEPRILYDSVRAGPHRPYVSGAGESGCDASIVHVVYEARQLYPAYIIEIELAMDAETAVAVGQGGDGDPGTSAVAGTSAAAGAAGPAPKRQRTAQPSAATPPGPGALGLAEVVAAMRQGVTPCNAAECERLLCRLVELCVVRNQAA